MPLLLQSSQCTAQSRFNTTAIVTLSAGDVIGLQAFGILGSITLEAAQRAAIHCLPPAA